MCRMWCRRYAALLAMQERVVGNGDWAGFLFFLFAKFRGFLFGFRGRLGVILIDLLAGCFAFWGERSPIP